MKPPGELAADVRRRAANRCQYCLMHQQLQGATFHVEHVIPRAAGGTDEPGNLTLACPSCNLHKANRITAIDPATGASVPLFHPGRYTWSEHFQFRVHRIEGLTTVGRATVGRWISIIPDASAFAQSKRDLVSTRRRIRVRPMAKSYVRMGAKSGEDALPHGTARARIARTAAHRVAGKKQVGGPVGGESTECVSMRQPLFLFTAPP